MQLSDPMTFEATRRWLREGGEAGGDCGRGSGRGKCNCHKLAQAASKDTLLISGGALRNQRESASQSEYSYLNSNMNMNMKMNI